MLEYRGMSSEIHGPWELDRALPPAASRRSVAWWVEIPLGVGLAILIVAAVLLIRNGIGSASAWADVVLTWLLLPVMLVGLLGLLALGGLVYTMARLLGWLPGRAAPAAAWLARFSGAARRASNRLAALLIRPLAAGAALEAGLRGRRRG
jgi:hypothetical protein